MRVTTVRTMGCTPRISTCAWAALLTVLAALPVAAEEATETAEATFVTTFKCSTCHSVEGAGIEATSDKMKSIDLTAYSTDDVAALGRFLRREEAREDEKHKKPYKGTDEELQRIVDWLAGLEPAAS